MYEMESLFFGSVFCVFNVSVFTLAHRFADDLTMYVKLHKYLGQNLYEYIPQQFSCEYSADDRKPKQMKHTPRACMYFASIGVPSSDFSHHHHFSILCASDLL